MSKCVSVIVTVYNKKDFVKRCLDSIVNQTDKSAQIIVVDDGSNDGSEKICDYYEKVGFEVYHTKNKGVSAARNFGLKKAVGDYITFLDADDAYTENALEILSKYAEKGLPIVQYGQYRYKTETELVKKDNAPNAVFKIPTMPKRWAMVWNKLYKASLIKDNAIKFIEGMQFGEDEMFNIECLIVAGEIKHAPQSLVLHYFDDTKSLCRGQLSLNRLERLDDELNKKLEQLVKDGASRTKIKWVKEIINRHRHSKVFQERGWERGLSGHYDVVYFLKNTPTNEELRYSLRSIVQNWQFRNVVFYGGCPNGIKPDRYVVDPQTAITKWQKVRNMLRRACDDEYLSEDFWLFNDDFFVLKPMPETMPPQYNGTIYQHIVHVEGRHGNAATDYTLRLRNLVKTLEKAGKPCLNYAVHKPMLINRKKMAEVLDLFPDEPMSRALYGNYWEIGGEDKRDMKVVLLNYSKMGKVENEWEFLSSQDSSFNCGEVGRFIKKKFNKPSRFEEV